MHAYGRTLRQAGDLRLLALPVGDGHERYCVADGLEPLAAFSTLEGALAAFDAQCAATTDAHRQEAAAGGADLAVPRRRRPAGRRTVRLTEGPR